MITTRICNTPGCGRTCPSTEHAYCRDCIGTVLHTGRPPELVSQPRVVQSPFTRAALAGKLPAKQVAA